MVEMPSQVDDHVAHRPVRIAFQLVDEDGAMLSAVAGEVALPIAVEIEPARHARAHHGAVPYGGVDRATLPRDVVRKTDINRQQPCHDPPPASANTATEGCF